MGKVSPVSAKYIIRALMHIDGSVDRPDIIGAIFGQTEGFLGNDLELRELQRSGKIGRIEVKSDVNNGKTSSHIIIPSSLDKAETAIIAAALETIERIGPCNSSAKIEKIEDVRISKRDFVIARAKELLKALQSEVLPDSQEITDEVAQSVRMMEITSWGPEHLPSGPMVEESEEVILVEGRADVLTLLKNGIKNAVAMNGTSVPESVKELCKQKVVTVFVDGDRGGDLIVRELCSITEVDYITKAPSGKEVEELTKKEIHLCLRNKVASAQYKGESTLESRQRRVGLERKPLRSSSSRPSVRREAPLPLGKNKVVFKDMLDNLIGTRGAYILDQDSNILGRVPTSELSSTLSGLKDVYAVVFDGMVTKDLAKAAEYSNARYLVGMGSELGLYETKVGVITSKDL